MSGIGKIGGDNRSLNRPGKKNAEKNSENRSENNFQNTLNRASNKGRINHVGNRNQLNDFYSSQSGKEMRNALNSDILQVSPEAQKLQAKEKGLELVKKADDKDKKIREQKVQEIKKKVEKGEYDIPAELVAEKMLNGEGAAILFAPI